MTVTTTAILFGACVLWFLGKLSKALTGLILIGLFVLFPIKALLVVLVLVTLMTMF